VTFATEYPGAPAPGIGTRPRGAVTIGGDAAGRVVVVVDVVVVDVDIVVVVVDDAGNDVLVGAVVPFGRADEPHAALAIRRTAPTMLRPRRRCTDS